MKSVNELFQEVKNNEGLKKKFLEACSKGEIEAFLKENGCDATIEEAKKYIEQEFRSGTSELSEEELALVVGGKSPDHDPKFKAGDYVNYRRNSHAADVRRNGHVITCICSTRFGEYQYCIRRDLEWGDRENLIDDAFEDDMRLISG